MTLKKSMPLILLLFTLVCALPATVISPPPSAIAQQDDDEAENLASGTVSNVLDNVNTARDNTNTQVSVPLRDQDHEAANLALNEGVDVDVDVDVVQKETLTTPTPSEEEEPPEFVAFCDESLEDVQCYETLQDCIVGQEFFNVEDPDCEGVETVPPDAGDCEVVRQAGEPVGATCNF